VNSSHSDQSGRHEHVRDLLQQNKRRLEIAKLEETWAGVGAAVEPVGLERAAELVRGMPSLKREDFFDVEDIASLVGDFVAESNELLVGDWPDPNGTSFVKIDKGEFLSLLDRMDDVYLFGFAITSDGNRKILYIHTDFDAVGDYCRYAIKEKNDNAPDQ
jgi:hypothetical protein